MVQALRRWLSRPLVTIRHICARWRVESTDSEGLGTSSSAAPTRQPDSPGEPPDQRPTAIGRIRSQSDPNESESRHVARDERDIVIGLDFGTSCTKAVIGDDVIQAAYAVPFGDFAHEGHPFLLPARLYVGRDGKMDLKDGEFRVTGLKLKLLADPNRRLKIGDGVPHMPTALELCVGYLALSIRLIRPWLLSEYNAMYRNTHLFWQLNLGIPSASYDDAALKDTFRLLGFAAYRVAVAKEPVDCNTVSQAIAAARGVM